MQDAPQNVMTRRMRRRQVHLRDIPTYTQSGRVQGVLLSNPFRSIGHGGACGVTAAGRGGVE